LRCGSYVLCGLALLTGMSCGANKPAAEARSPAHSSLRVGLVFDSGGRGDKSFNDSAYAGLKRAETELGVKSQTVDSKSQSDYESNLEALSDAGNTLVIAVGINMKNAVEKVAPKHPDVKYAVIDASVDGQNVRSLLFKEEEGSFLAGYVAGLCSKTKRVGFVGGMELPIIKKFEVGYRAGATAANPDVHMLPAKYTGGWDNVDDAKAAATALFGSGADIVYHAAGRAGLGVIEAAKEAKKFAIGVDSDQDYLEKGTVLTSMIKHVDNAVFDTISDAKSGQFTPGAKVYDLKAGGVGLSPMTYTKDIVGQANLRKVRAISAQIAAGTITIPTK
jgi:basic membrane protein A